MPEEAHIETQGREKEKEKKEPVNYDESFESFTQLTPKNYNDYVAQFFRVSADAVVHTILAMTPRRNIKSQDLYSLMFPYERVGYLHRSKGKPKDSQGFVDSGKEQRVMPNHKHHGKAATLTSPREGDPSDLRSSKGGNEDIRASQEQPLPAMDYISTKFPMMRMSPSTVNEILADSTMTVPPIYNTPQAYTVPYTYTPPPIPAYSQAQASVPILQSASGFDSSAYTTQPPTTYIYTTQAPSAYSTQTPIYTPVYNTQQAFYTAPTPINLTSQAGGVVPNLPMYSQIPPASAFNPQPAPVAFTAPASNDALANRGLGHQELPQPAHSQHDHPDSSEDGSDSDGDGDSIADESKRARYDASCKRLQGSRHRHLGPRRLRRYRHQHQSYNNLNNTGKNDKDMDVPVYGNPPKAKTHEKPTQFHLPFLIIDTRRKDEYKESHIHGAVNIHYSKGEDIEIPDWVTENTLIVTYCAVGLRSGLMQYRLRSQGFIDVRVLSGGYYKWVNEGRPIFSHKGEAATVLQQHSIAGLMLRREARRTKKMIDGQPQDQAPTKDRDFMNRSSDKVREMSEYGHDHQHCQAGACKHKNRV